MNILHGDWRLIVLPATAQIVLAGLSNVAEIKIYSPTTNNITITNVGGFTPNILAEIIAVDFTGEKGDTPWK